MWDGSEYLIHLCFKTNTYLKFSDSSSRLWNKSDIHHQHTVTVLYISSSWPQIMYNSWSFLQCVLAYMANAFSEQKHGDVRCWLIGREACKMNTLYRSRSLPFIFFLSTKAVQNWGWRSAPAMRLVLPVLQLQEILIFLWNTRNLSELFHFHFISYLCLLLEYKPCIFMHLSLESLGNFFSSHFAGYCSTDYHGLVEVVRGASNPWSWLCYTVFALSKITCTLHFFLRWCEFLFVRRCASPFFSLCCVWVLSIHKCSQLLVLR